jgi:hypothetical protein
MMEEILQTTPADMKTFTPMRKISLRKLEATLKELKESGKQIPHDIYFLSGLQQIQYVFVCPEQKDIILAGPAEGWKIGKNGIVVGQTTGRPVMTIDDLLVALRTAKDAQRQAISCSIDPRPEGYVKLQQYFNTKSTMGNPEVTIANVEKALGPQKITVTGVPATSHFARVLVAADFQMKRIAMGFEPSPVRGLPNYLNMLKVSGMNNSSVMPRWWLEPRYESVIRSPDGLAWELNGASVKAMTDQDFFKANGSKENIGKPNPVAQRWADLMTKKFDKLAIADPIFGELRNCMELAVAASLIVREDLPQRAGCDMSMLMSPKEIEVDVFDAPKQVDTQANFVKRGRNYIISASGGVQINTPALLKDIKTSENLAKVRTKAEKTETKNWWWN